MPLDQKGVISPWSQVLLPAKSIGREAGCHLREAANAGALAPRLNRAASLTWAASTPTFATETESQ